MKRIEKAVMAEVAAGGAALVPALAEQALLLARRLDAEPDDRAATALSRELRLVLRDLRSMAATAPSELDTFLAEINASSLGGRG